jgi:hypothetical protein
MEYEEHKESDLKQFRKVGNSKLDIFQTFSEPVFRNFKLEPKLQKFQNSFEHQKIKSDSIQILSNASNSIIFALATNNSITKTNHLMKKLFTTENISTKENKMENISEKHKLFVKRIKKKQLKDDPEFKRLSDLIESPKFDEIMRSDKRILKAVLKHKFLKYHDQYKRILRTYLKVLRKEMVSVEFDEDFYDEEDFNENEIVNEEEMGDNLNDV